MALAGVLTTTLWAEKHSVLQPQTAAEGVDVSRFDVIPAAVERAIAEKKLPGAVVLVGRGAQVLYQKAFGRRAVEPAPEPMTHRHDLRSGVAHENRGHDDQHHEAHGRRTDSNERSGRHVHSWVRALWQGRYHHPPSDDAHVRLAARSRSRRLVVRLRHRDHAGDRGSPDVLARRAIRLQRHQLHPPRRHRPPGERSTAERVCARAHFRAAGHEGHHVPSGGVVEAADRADRKMHSVRLAVRRVESSDAPWGGARSDRAPDGRGGGSRRIIRDCCGRLDLLPDDSRRRILQRHAHPLAADGGQNDHGRRRPWRTRARMGHRHGLLVEPR